MNSTSASLLERVRRPGDQQAWARLVELYTPLIYYWARRAGLQSQEASDLVQEVFAVLVQKMPEFQYDERKSFRGWLRTITMNKWRDRGRRSAVAPTVADLPLSELAGAADPDPFGDAEYRQMLVSRAMEFMQSEFQPATWKAFLECTVSSRAAEDVARELGLTVNAVYLAKSRVLRRLREELHGLLD